MTRFILLIVLGALIVSGCSRNRADGPERTEAEQYAQIQQQLSRNNFLNAIDELQELEARFPYGDYAEQAQLDTIYAHFRALDYPSAVASAGRFIRNYPNHQHVDYAIYMRGLANYNMDRGLTERLVRTDRSYRDLSSWRDAFRDFQDLVNRFPESEYAPDARSRMLHIRNQMARHELHAARYYARRHAYIASANRAQYVVRHFQGTEAVEEAMAILYKSYRALGRDELVENSYAVFMHNWPDSAFVDNGDIRIDWWPADQRTWLRLLTFDLLE